MSDPKTPSGASSRRGAASAGVIDRVSTALADFSGLLLLIVVVLVNVEIGMRYFMGSSTLIADEYSGYLFVWMSLFGFGHALATGQFLRVEALVVRFGRRGRQAAMLLGALAGCFVAAVSAYACWQTFAGSWQFGSRSIQPSATPLWIPQIGLPVALAWLALLFARQAVRALAGRLPVATEAADEVVL